MWDGGDSKSLWVLHSPTACSPCAEQSSVPWHRSIHPSRPHCPSLEHCHQGSAPLNPRDCRIHWDTLPRKIRERNDFLLAGKLGELPAPCQPSHALHSGGLQGQHGLGGLGRSGVPLRAGVPSLHSPLHLSLSCLFLLSAISGLRSAPEGAHCSKEAKTHLKSLLEAPGNEPPQLAELSQRGVLSEQQ